MNRDMGELPTKWKKPVPYLGPAPSLRERVRYWVYRLRVRLGVWE